LIHGLSFNNLLRLLETIIEVPEIIISHVPLLLCKVIKVVHGSVIFIFWEGSGHSCAIVANVAIITHLLLIILSYI